MPAPTMKVVLLLCVVVGVVFSQVPTPCSSPPQFEGREVRIDHSQKYEEKRKLYYDSINMRTRTYAEVDVASTEEFYDRLYLFKENKNYTIGVKSRTCNVTTITRPFHHRGVHPNATYDTVVTLGATGIPKEFVTVALFSANETNDFYSGMVTYPGCLPVQNIYISKEYGFEHSFYFDLTIGITDTSVFTPPPECHGL